jgi:hypothetical protein
MMSRNQLIVAAIAALAAVFAGPVAARAAEATFTRDLTVNGRIDLSVVSGSGKVHLTAGPAGHLHIVGHVKSGWGNQREDAVRKIADHPPIEQTGNIVRIGQKHPNEEHVSIDYEIQAPADCYLDAATGSGNVSDEGVGVNAKLGAGSGNIQATNMHGEFTVSTGSGSIDVSQSGPGDVKASTGSGTIHLSNLRGGLHASTGSGSIHVQGTPAAPWHITADSGNVEIETGNAAFTLEASAGSGTIQCNRQIASLAVEGRHRLQGNISGGGPEVHIGTGSGSIHIN